MSQVLEEEKTTVGNVNKYFVCIFLGDEGDCLVEKKKCPQDKCEKHKQVEDIFQ